MQKFLAVSAALVLFVIVTADAAPDHVARAQAVTEPTTASKSDDAATLDAIEVLACDRAIGGEGGSDTCLHVVAPHDGTMHIAGRQRMAQLTPSLPAPDLKPVKINPGVIYNKAGQPLAPLAVDSPSGTNYVLKLVHATNGREAMMIYLIGGRPFQTKAPLGTYKIRGASGATWYGMTHLFGPDTGYFKMRSKGSTTVDGDNFTFSRSGNTVHGFRITLIKQSGGNLETDPIKPEEF